MQRRAAAIYVAFFIVIGAASYSLIATAESPTIQFQNPEHELSKGDSFTVGGQQYTVAKIEASMEGGGHGSAASLVRSGQLAWTNQSARYTETWDNNSTVTYQGTDYRVLIPNTSDPAEFTLQDPINRTKVLEQDSGVKNQTVTQDGQEYVVKQDGGNLTLVPADEYFPAPAETTYAEGDEVQYNGNATTFTDVTTESVTLAWNAPKENTIDLSDRGNVSLQGETYLAYFPDNSTLVLTQDFESYDQQVAEIDTYHKHVNGLRGVSMVSIGIAVLILGMAYMPSRY